MSPGQSRSEVINARGVTVDVDVLPTVSGATTRKRVSAALDDDDLQVLARFFHASVAGTGSIGASQPPLTAS
ncbi:hypothetical protein BO94DRAFT_585299 [Aspergillus sclerotioniger CBS 115572]|uniref:Uncharacterized protein n=1 Tax=Aspergillus sclerotioniger CBS 115572 TaxID=1450535 RepID=A0A317WMX5_9EURO|nr:hypothetical protein BO94DRAFT_585299 [Aspergillus sclerotioniger CBS 115572]PWY87814.1 hypothetical protein BO94DRAFT_585299 [Aspergillus sclerotioniger CBS 115572]